MSNDQLLLTVEERFQLSGIGLTLLPDFAVPSGKWRNLQVSARVIIPSGEELPTVAQLNMTHFNIPNPKASLDKRWRILVTLPELTKEQVPLGSKLYVSSEVREAVLIGKAE
jgi:hypothetical protein